MRMKITITGIVQGVGFRPFIYRIAVENSLRGYVQNRGDAGVEVLLEGRKDAVENFLSELREKKPPLAQIYEIATERLPGSEECREFSIKRSSAVAERSGSVIPPDIAICNDCLRELRDPEDPRFDYFFITCTNCGPRFTIIEKLPYDRENTTMREFPMCSFCLREYGDPLNRRFHAQTVACPPCGPSTWLTNNCGKRIEHKDPIREAGRLLSKGKILAIKGYGGFHIAASALIDRPLRRLREVKHRSQKPFAIMARNLEAVKAFAGISSEEARLMSSYPRPIVLLNKKKTFNLSGLIAPGLHNVGVMLPYTGMHFMLFDRVKDSAFVMTSANPPNQPIIKANEEALETLNETVDYFLFHNRGIAQRCDDSVLRMHGKNQVFLRRSRGYAPAPVRLKKKTSRCVVALGGELNDTSCVLLGDKAFISQHIGDVENLETEQFLRKATDHLIHLTNGKVEAIACDLHPKFATTRLAHELAEENRWQLLQVQHHHAHAAGLMAEHELDEMVAICCDGYGYGTDGEAWGGEIFLCRKEHGDFERVAHLEKQPLLGGDLATRYPLRMAAGILYDKIEIDRWLMMNKNHFPHGENEIITVLNQLEKRKDIPGTTSCGRVLDAAAAILGLCFERTYEGEPAMKLESAARGGKDTLKLKPSVKDNVLETDPLILELFQNRRNLRTRDLAYSVHKYLAEGLAMQAVEHARKNEINKVGFSGGSACNEIFTSIMRGFVEGSGLRFFVHEAVSPGDGGVSFGQAVIGGFFQT